MSTGAWSRMRCRGCAADVPAGDFCGLCGFDQGGPAGGKVRLLRPRSFVFAPGERVLRPYLLSSLFPQLPRRSRASFRIALIIGAIALVGLAVLKLSTAEMTVAALGVPLLFVLYLCACSGGRSIPRTSLVVAAALGAALGAGWELVTDQLVARSYTVPISTGLALQDLVSRMIKFTFLLGLMMVPALVLRVWPSRTRKSLHGFAIGALGALAFTAAVTMARLTPQFTSGLVAHDRPVQGLLVQAGLIGMTVPVTVAATGGIAGILLWFRHPSGGAAAGHPGRVRLVLALLVAGALLAQSGLGPFDVTRRFWPGLTEVWILVIHLAITLLVLVALRIALQITMLHEAHDPVDEAASLTCAQCGRVVAEMVFCSECGAAMVASDRPSRRPSTDWVVSRWVTAMGAIVLVLSAIEFTLTSTTSNYLCPPDCGRPLSSLPFENNPRFTAADGQFSVGYPGSSAYRVVTEATRVTATWTAGDGGVMQFFSEPAAGRSPRDIAKATVKKSYPDARVAYEIPNAMVGYQPGYGEIYDYWPQNPSARSSRIRILVMVAVKDDLALIASAEGPFREFGPDSGPGHPSGANLRIAEDMGRYVNSFTWPGDPPR